MASDDSSDDNRGTASALTKAAAIEQQHSRSTRLRKKKGGARQDYSPQDQGPDLQVTHNALSEDHACGNNK